MKLYRQNVIGIQRIPDILGQWENPAFDWGRPNSVAPVQRRHPQ